MTKSQQERLGVRLIASSAPTDADLAALHELLTFYGAILETTSERIRSGLDIRTTSRLKNTGTILEKLQRSGGATLKSMQDLAGMRIVGGPDRREQDETVSRVVELFRGEAREPKVIDRRANPVHGYSAVHVIVFPEGVPVEVQIRTTWQHEWAEVFEKLADQIGRGIRYGEEPERISVAKLPTPLDGPSATARIFVEANERFAEFEGADHRYRETVVGRARSSADLIASYEEAIVASARSAETSNALVEIRTGLAALRASIKDLRRLESQRASIDAQTKALRDRHLGIPAQSPRKRPS